MNRVLVVDDSLTVRMDLAEAFEQAGLDPVPCANLAAARRALSQQPVDVAVLDVVLPDGDGVALLRELREGAHASLPVLMLSSEAEVADRIRGISTGADEYVGKPYDKRRVVARALELLRDRQQPPDGPRPVLVIDDSFTFRETLKAALVADGKRVITAETGEEGLRLAALERPSALIVDGVLPGIDGPSVIRHVRLDGALRSLPCVLLTAADEVQAELAALDSGADAFLRKDQDVEVILARLNAVLRASDHDEAARDTTSLQAPKRLLLLGGDEEIETSLVARLRQDGYEVVGAEGTPRALDFLAFQEFDAALIVVAPQPDDSRQLCQTIKQSPQTRDLPVLLLSRRGERSSMLDELASGADDCVPVSTDYEVFKARLRALLRRRQIEQETRRAREQLLVSEHRAAEARSARELAETRAALVQELESKNQELEGAYRELQQTQARLVQSAKMASLGELVAGVAHEINNPLAFALSHLNTARRSLEQVAPELPASEPVQAHWKKALTRLNEMVIGLDRIRELVVKLRTFSRLDEGEQKRVSVRECVESVLTILHHRIGPDTRVETDLAENDELECYPSLLNQALMNLCANALDAMSGEGRLRITTERTSEQFVITVADNGPGIPDALRDRVLEPFFTTKPVGQGTGLGLSITYSIVQKHGGTLELREAEGGGTVASMRLPVVRK